VLATAVITRARTHTHTHSHTYAHSHLARASAHDCPCTHTPPHSITCAIRSAHPLTITIRIRTRMWPHSQVLPVVSTSGWGCQLRAACQVWSGFERWVHTNHPQHWLRRRVWLPLWQRCRHCVGELGCGVCRAMHLAATPMKRCVALWPAMVCND
jgi:hypothetical protein